MSLDIGLGDEAAEELAIFGRGQLFDGEQSVEHALGELFRFFQQRENGVFELLVRGGALGEIGEFGFEVGDKPIKEVTFMGRLDFEEQDGELERFWNADFGVWSLRSAESGVWSAERFEF